MIEGKIGKYIRIINQFYKKKRERERETDFKKIAETMREKLAVSRGQKRGEEEEEDDKNEST